MMLRGVARFVRRVLPPRLRPRAKRVYLAMTCDPRELERYFFSDDPARRKGWSLVESRLHWFIDTYLHRIPSRRQQGYLTHLPVLLAVAEEISVKRVLELGCGDYSTLAFLDRDCFPDLHTLVSLENYVEWASKIAQRAGDDRLDMHIIEGPLADALGAFDLNSFDLIFVDDALTRDERARTISTLAAANLVRPIVVIHDFDIPIYRRAARGFRRRLRFTALNPNTGVVWNRPDFVGRRVKSMNAFVRHHRTDIPLDDRVAHQRWIKERFASEAPPTHPR